MYKAHFGFRESPFQLVPNPAYLFLSKSHEEALAHLDYAIAQGDGFVEITGEVGTGKTTLCRAFIERLDETGETVEVAYIFNPMLSAVELLGAIHDEFGLQSPSTDSVKSLIDSLNTFLLDKKAAGKRVLLLIDEAQSLSRDVLEQIRLLSNLETSTEKLLQIVLVGQPELKAMLDSHELRQLSQRITLRAHLTPLSRTDVVRYVCHRLQIAGPGTNNPFTRAAFRRIYHYSKGVPRLIHIVCNRALLVAYVLNRKTVTGRIVRTAIRELSGHRRGGNLRDGIRVPVSALGLVFVAGLAGIAFYAGGYSLNSLHFLDKPVVKAVSPATEINQVAEIKPASTDGPIPAVVAPVIVAPAPLPFVSRKEAFLNAISPWGMTVEVTPEMEAVANDLGFFAGAAEKNGFELYRLEGDFPLLCALNLPAILTFYDPGAGSLQYLVLTRMETDRMFFTGAGGADGAGLDVRLDAREVAARWSGVAYIPWKNFLQCRGTIPLGAPEHSIIVVKELLKNLGYGGIDSGGAYDEGSRAAIKAIQAKYGVKVDGLVGSLTKILLYNEQGTFDIPFLVKSAPADEKGRP